MKIGFFRSDADLLYHDEIHGDLFAQVAQTQDLLLTKYLRAGISYRGLQRREQFPVPEAALREAVLNAIIHKDYAAGTPIQISVYAHKLLLWNPGALPPDWTVAKLKGKHPSQPFNPDVANAFFRAGLIEAWGRGIARMMQACRAAGTPPPVLRYEPSGLWVEFEIEPAEQGAPPVTPPVTPPVDALVRLLGQAGALGNAQIRGHLGLKDRTHLRERYVDPALAAGLIEPTLPEKLTSRLQQYRLTPKGIALLATLKAP